MNAAEIITLLEDFNIVPHHVGRADVKRAFSLVQHALAGVRGPINKGIWCVCLGRSGQDTQRLYVQEKTPYPSC